MHHLRIIFTVWIGLWAIAVHGQTPPKREFRAAWVCTLANLDWPSAAGLPAATQKREFIRLLDRLQAIGIHAVMVQVRPAGDAFYPSELAPWSQYLTGKQGQSPGYDPLAFMVQECHQRNIEFHAWFNPFRAVSHTRFSSVVPEHASNKHPDWCYTYGETRYFDPGHPAARAYVIACILEVADKYDIDGIHLDDYFYPYPLSGKEIPDTRNWNQFKGNQAQRSDWRRANVDAFVQALSDSLHKAHPRMKFGISPFGIWRNRFDDVNGSDTGRAFSAYDGLYADTRRWFRDGWVDYMAPQLYWSSGHPRYKTLLEWWKVQNEDRHVYVGHGLYLMQSSKVPAWASSKEFLEQARLTRTHPQVAGDIWFRTSTLQANPSGFSDDLAREMYAYPALPPTMPWKDSIPPMAPDTLLCQWEPDGISLDWEPPVAAPDGDLARYYLVYRFEEGEELDLDNPTRIVSVQRGTRYFDERVEKGKVYRYLVSSVDRMHNESQGFAQQSIQY